METLGRLRTVVAAIWPTVRGRSRNASKQEKREGSARLRKSTGKGEGDAPAVAAFSIMADPR